MRRQLRRLSLGLAIVLGLTAFTALSLPGCSPKKGTGTEMEGASNTQGPPPSDLPKAEGDMKPEPGQGAMGPGMMKGGKAGSPDQVKKGDLEER